MIRRKYANMRIYEDNIDFADVENTITYSLSAKNLENNLNKREEELCNKISDLEAKLSELREQIAIRDEENGKIFMQSVNAMRENVELKHQLTEKEKERELDNSFWKQECDSLQKTLVEKDKEIEKLTEELDDKNFCKDFVDLYAENKLKTQMLHENWKDKISFTIAELEKVKSAFGLINSKLDKVETIKEYIHYIDHQINELKGKVGYVKD